VLQHNPDLFDPQLPTQHQAALSKMYPGLVNKCFLGFDTAFWDPKLHFFGTLAPDKGRYNLYHNCQLHTNQPVLCTFGFGDFAYAFEQQTEADRLAEIHERLKGMFGNNTPAPNWAIASAWHADPYAKGSYSSPVVGLTGQEANVWATPAAEDKVWFAGEHTSTKYRGTVHGALLSGQSVAAALIRALQ
jgi:monoamine oxidase